MRDNLLETSAAVVTTAGDITYANGANSMARLALAPEGNVLRAGATAPEWVSMHPQFTGDRSATGSVSSSGTQKVTASLAIPAGWSTGWTCMAWGAGRFIWNGSATTGDAELYVAGAPMAPGTEQDVEEKTTTGTMDTVAFSLIGCDVARSDVGVVSVGLFMVANGAADYADLWVSAIGFYENN